MPETAFPTPNARPQKRRFADAELQKAISIANQVSESLWLIFSEGRPGKQPGGCQSGFKGHEEHAQNTE